jgi:hypothetical protein
MSKQNAQESDIGQNPDSKKKPSSPTSRTKRMKPEGTLESQTDQLKNGSNSETQKTTDQSESEQPSGSKTTPKKSKSLMPVPKEVKDRTLQALKWLKVKPESLLAAPPLTPMLKTTIKGGLQSALDAMRFATDDNEIRSFLMVYDKVPVGYMELISWEAIAISAKVNIKHLLGAIQLAVQTHCWNRSRFIAISNHPDVMDARVKYAKMAGGERDRTQLDISLGFLQSPKGPTFIGKQVAVFGGNGGQGKAKGDEDEGKTIEAQYDSSDGFDDLFPSPNDIQDKLVPIRQRLLEG